MFSWTALIASVLGTVAQNYFKKDKDEESGGLVQRVAPEPPYKVQDVNPFQYTAEYRKDTPFSSKYSPGATRQPGAALTSVSQSKEVSNHFERMFKEAIRKAKGIG
jgi:hypothetical protein